MNAPGLVSIVIPAYKATYLEAALKSALKQNYHNIEVVICDDSPDDRISMLVDNIAENSPWPVRYFRNGTALGEIGNVTRCVSEARGEYIKFLYDDDVLVPDCVRLLVDLLEGTPSLSLVSSRRRLIDGKGEFIPDHAATRFPFEGDVVLDGESVVAFWRRYIINFVGEPSSVLCRRADLISFEDGIFSLDGEQIQWVGDLAIYAKLLRKGNLGLLVRPLSYFRISREQYSQKARDNREIGIRWHERFKELIGKLAWGSSRGDEGKILYTALDKKDGLREYDLLSHFVERPVPEVATGRVFEWLSDRALTSHQRDLIRERLRAEGGGASILVVLRDSGKDPRDISASLSSLQGHLSFLSRLRVIVLSTRSDVTHDVLDSRIVWKQVSSSQMLSSVNELAASVDSDWLMVADAGVGFTECGLTMLALELIGDPDCRALYADEIYRTEAGELGIALKPDFNLDLLLSLPVSITRSWFFRRRVFVELGGFDQKWAAAPELDLILRLVEDGGMAGLGHLTEPVCINGAPVMRDDLAHRARIQNHLVSRGYTAVKVESALPGRYRVRYGHQEQPLVSILIPTKNQLPMVQRCIETLIEHTRYPNYEILLIDNNSDTPDALRWLQGLSDLEAEKLRVFRYPHPFNFSAINNYAVTEARGEYLVLLNNDTAIVQGDWLDEMLNHALRPEVGVVGARLLYPDGRIQHAGVVLGLGGPAEHPFNGMPSDAVGYMQRLQVDQNYSAVTAACMMIRKSVYEAVGGMDEDLFEVSYNDVDLCLKVRELGYLTVWTPHAVVLHEANVSQKAIDPDKHEEKRKRFIAEQDAMYAKWLPLLARDPAYNSNLSLTQVGGFELADAAFTWQPLRSWRPLPNLLVHHADMHGCGHYRAIQPFAAMRNAGLVDGAVSLDLLQPADLERYSPDVILLQRQIGEDRLEAMRRMKAFSPAFKVYELDDYLPNLPIKNIHRQHMPKDIFRSLRRGLSYVDRFIVSTERLADAFCDLHSDIRVVENRLPVSWWADLKSSRRVSAKPRVGWAGGVSHTGDLEILADVVRDMADQVEWVFLGMCPDKLRPFVEYHPGVAIEEYPSKLASLNLDLAIAPLEQNLFNECKSNLRLLEYGACGFPVICSDVLCYRGALPVTRVKNRYRDWMDALGMHLADLDATARRGDELQAIVRRDWMLDGAHVADWARAWTPN